MFTKITTAKLNNPRLRCILPVIPACLKHAGRHSKNGSQPKTRWDDTERLKHSGMTDSQSSAESEWIRLAFASSITGMPFMIGKARRSKRQSNS